MCSLALAMIWSITHPTMQDLKDFARQPGCDVVYSDIGRDRDGRG